MSEMSIEMSTSSVGFDTFDDYNERLGSTTASHLGHHKVIFSQEQIEWPFTRRAHHEKSHVHPIAQRAAIVPMKTEREVEGGVRMEWGGEDGVHVSGNVKGKVSDDKGNSAEVKYERENGRNYVDVKVGHKNQNTDKKN